MINTHKLPELPPGYQVSFERAADYGPDVTEDFWGIYVRGEWCDIYPDPPTEREDAVALAWSIWLDNDADAQWRAFIEPLLELAAAPSGAMGRTVERIANDGYDGTRDRRTR